MQKGGVASRGLILSQALGCSTRSKKGRWTLPSSDECCDRVASTQQALLGVAAGAEVLRTSFERRCNITADSGRQQ